jgi:predicted nucleotidyltransferase
MSVLARYTAPMFEDVLAHLTSDGVRFVVTGGHAVCFHGYERPVEDLDIVVDREREAATRTMQSLMRIGFFPTIPLHLSDVVVMTFMDGRGRRLDVNARYRFPFPELAERATTRTVGGLDVAVISLEDLIEVKNWRGRQYDLDDVAQLEARQKQT